MSTRKPPGPPKKPTKPPRGTKLRLVPGDARKRPPEPRKGGDDARIEAMRLLAEGYQVTAVAETVAVDERTVRRWRDSPEGQRELAVAREARAAAFAASAEEARRVLREAAVPAAMVLAEQLGATDPEVANRAARAILDRIGVPRTERVETAATGTEDLGRLSDEELATYEALQRKAKGGA